MAEVTIERHRDVHWGSAAVAGLIGGAIFLVLEMVMMPLFVGGSAWGPPRMIAAIALGRDVLPPPATFEAGVLLTAALLHFMLSALYGLVLGAVLRRTSLEMGLLAGAVFGLALYFVNFYLMTAVFPWFEMARNWVSVFAHIAFGIATAWAYVALIHSQPTARTG